jgi:3-keto-disaccharide hydrolase
MISKLFLPIDGNVHVRVLWFLAVLGMIACHCPAQTADGPGERIEGFTDTPMLPGGSWHQHDPNRPQPPVVTPGASFSLGAGPPSDAEVLFDGKDLSKWEGGPEQNPNWKGQDASWKVRDGYVEVAPPNGNDIRTRDRWSDFQLHVEWATPDPPTGHGQARGNSGILINDMYEIQVLDSYHDKTYPDGLAGALYGQMPPLVNPSKPPGQWQTYDIIWESPRWNDKGELTQKACVTVIYNGVVVQHRKEFIGRTEGIGDGVAYKAKPFYQQHDPAVFIQLQNHHSNPVRFRNIWIRDLNLAEQQ